MSKDYLIWSNQHGAWWGPHSKGYTRSVLCAGLYTKDEAERIAANGLEKAVSLSSILDEARRWHGDASDTVVGALMIVERDVSEAETVAG